MKLESLKSSKFEAFKENEISNLFTVIGGRCFNTAGGGNERFDTATGDSNGDGTSNYVRINGEEVRCDRFVGRCDSPVKDGVDPMIVLTYMNDILLYEEEVLECE